MPLLVHNPGEATDKVLEKSEDDLVSGCGVSWRSRSGLSH